MSNDTGVSALAYNNFPKKENGCPGADGSY